MLLPDEARSLPGVGINASPGLPAHPCSPAKQSAAGNGADVTCLRAFTLRQTCINLGNYAR